MPFDSGKVWFAEKVSIDQEVRTKEIKIKEKEARRSIAFSAPHGHPPEETDATESPKTDDECTKGNNHVAAANIATKDRKARLNKWKIHLEEQLRSCGDSRRKNLGSPCPLLLPSGYRVLYEISLYIFAYLARLSTVSNSSLIRAIFAGKWARHSWLCGSDADARNCDLPPAIC